MVQEQRRLALAPLQPPCSHTFTSSHGLPCSHTLKKLEEEKSSLLLEHFYPHWNLKRGVDRPQPILEPRQALEEGIKRSCRPATSTRREPSGFEISDFGRKAPSTCSRCHAAGHTRSSRSCPLRFQELLTLDAPALELAPLPDVLTVDALMPANPIEPSVARTGLLGNVVEVPDNPTQVMGSAHVDKRPSITYPSPASQDPVVAPDLHSYHVSASPVEVVQKLSSKEALTHQLPPQPPQRYDSPEAIFQKYIVARNVWYAALPAGIIKTNQQYRRAVGLPLRYDKSSYEWCLDYKQMSRYCITPTGTREWTKEEMMAYLD